MAGPSEVSEREFRCAGCGATLQYAPGTPSLKCPYCGRENRLEATGRPIVEHDLAELDLVPFVRATGFGAATRQFRCDRCGATTSLVGATTATRCDFCGSSVVVEAPPVPGMIRPESLIPFQVNRQQATLRFQEWIRHLWFRPSNLKRMAGLAQIRGLYVPHFTYDANAVSHWSGQAGYYYYVTVGEGENRRQERRIRWEYRSGTHHAFYDDILICASRGIPEEILRKIYPFHLRGLVPYAPQYLSGFAAEAYTVDPRAGWTQAQRIMRQREESACSSELGGDTQRALHVDTRLSEPKWKHLLLPAFVASYVYGAKTYRFMVNGQTGEIQGEAPWSWIKIGAAVGVAILVAVAATKLLGWW